MLNLIIIVVGLAFGVLMFWKLPALAKGPAGPGTPGISVIIPMRNEAGRIAGLLSDLRLQSLPPLEVICVDDESTDSCGDTAGSLGAKVIRIDRKPEGWIGKTFACQTGAEKSAGGLLLFLDADIRLSPDALESIAGEYQRHRCPISIQPYHAVSAFYEHFSLFFNLILVGSMGIGLPFPHKGVGFFGPVLMIPRELYASTGGHGRVRKELLEDLEMGRHYARNRIRFRLLIGGQAVAFRMYPDGPRSLWEGWTKGFFTAAVSIPAVYLVGMVWLVTAYTGAAVTVAVAALRGDWAGFAAASAVYLASCVHILLVSRRIGGFHPLSAVCYPIFLAGFHVIFFFSAFKRLVLREVVWKGRRIKT